jgi:hypothetical protein
MAGDEERLDSEAKALLSRTCSRPIRLSSGVFVRCGSRIKSRCPSCAELYRGDWARIARSGIFDGPVADFRFYLLTLTAPSFGQVHRVPRSVEVVHRCGCGDLHTAADASLRGVPLNAATYDYLGQVAWNRDSGVLWDRTRKRLRDRWDSLEYFLVREWQDRGVLHLHLLVRIARVEAPTATQLRDDARTASAFSRIDGSHIEWGAQADCKPFRADGDGARTVWYLSKALNYVMKDTALQGLDRTSHSWEHLARLEAAARAIRCSPGCDWECVSLVHRRYGSRSQVVSASRRTKNRTGWSFTGLTRTVQRRLRKEWFDSQGGAAEPASAPDLMLLRRARERLSARYVRELKARLSAVP